MVPKPVAVGAVLVVENKGAGAAAPNGFAWVLVPKRFVDGVVLKAKALVVVAGAPKPVIGLLNKFVPPD